MMMSDRRGASEIQQILSQDIIVHCFHYLGLVDLLTCRRTSAIFRECAKVSINTKKQIFFCELAGILRLKRDGVHCLMDQDRNQVRLRLKKTKAEICISTILTDTILSKHPESVQVLDLSCLNFSNLPSLYNLSNLIQLNLTGCHHLHPNVLLEAFTKRKNQPLKSLNLTGCRRITGDTISCIATHCPYIEILWLSGCSQSLDDTSLISICNSLVNLISLNISGFDRITDTAMITVFMKLKRLKLLDISSCKQIRWNFLKPSGQQIEEWISSHEDEDTSCLFQLFRSGKLNEARQMLNMSFPILVDPFSLQLRVAGIAFGTNLSKGLPRNMVTIMALSSLGRLNEIVVSGSSCVTNADIINLAKICGDNLLHLEIACCQLIGDSSLEILGIECNRLNYLDCSFCPITNKGVAALGKIEALCYLKCQSLHKITDEGILSISNLKQLLYLNFDFCCNLSVDAVLQVCMNLPNLVELGMREITSRSKLNSSSLKDRLAYYNGRQIKENCHQSRCCSFRSTSTRNNANEGIHPQRSYECKQCSLTAAFNRFICKWCAERCHSGHDGLVVSSTCSYFYCDCSFGMYNSCYFVNFDQSAEIKSTSPPDT
jgi:hypothetical protein